MKLVFIDPKKTEFGGCSRLLNHYLAVTQDSDSADDEKARAIVKTAEAADTTLKSLCQEMDNRYHLLEMAGTPNLLEYLDKWNARKLNPQNGHHFLPYIVMNIPYWYGAREGLTQRLAPEASCHLLDRRF